MKRFLMALAIALECVLLTCCAALADGVTAADVYSELQTKQLNVVEPGTAKSSVPHTKEHFQNHLPDVQFVEIPGGGFIALWNDVHILDEIDAENNISEPIEDGILSFALSGQDLIGHAQSIDPGEKILLVQRSDNGDIASLVMGQAGSYDVDTCCFALAQETQTQPTRATDYVLGYCAGSSENSIQLHTLLGGEQGHRYPFDLSGIPVASGVTVDLNGAFVVDGDVISADFWPWEFDVDVNFSISMNCESINVHAESPCLTGSVDIIPIKIPLIPEVLTLDCSPKLFLDATASAEVEFAMSCTLGGEVWIDSDFNAGFIPVTDADMSLKAAKISTEVYCGVSVGGDLSLMDVCGIDLRYKVGYVLTATASAGHFDVDDADKSRWHACEDLQCFQGTVRPRKGPFGVDVEVLGVLSQNLWTITEPEDGDSILSFYDSLSFGDKDWTLCPHYGYPLDVVVIDPATGNAVEGAVVSAAGCEDAFREAAGGVTTDAQGRATLYIPLANPSGDSLKEGDHSYSIQLSAVYTTADGQRITMENCTFAVTGLNENKRINNTPLTLTLKQPCYLVEFYYNYDGRSGTYPATPNSIETRYGQVGQEVSATETDRSPHVEEVDPSAGGLDIGNPSDPWSTAGPDIDTPLPTPALTLYLDDQAPNILSGTIGEMDQEPLRLKLYYAIGCSIVFNPGDGQGGLFGFPVIRGDSYTLPGCPFLAPAGKMFDCWKMGDTACRPGQQIIADNINGVSFQAAWKDAVFVDPDWQLPAGTREVGENAFEGISASVVAIPSGCRQIGAGAFRNCKMLQAIRIPADCSLGEGVFDGCAVVYVFGVSGSPAEAYCSAHENCVFVQEDQ